MRQLQPLRLLKCKGKWHPVSLREYLSGFDHHLPVHSASTDLWQPSVCLESGRGLGLRVVEWCGGLGFIVSQGVIHCIPGCDTLMICSVHSTHIMAPVPRKETHWGPCMAAQQMSLKDSRLCSHDKLLGRAQRQGTKQEVEGCYLTVFCTSCELNINIPGFKKR